MSDWDDAVTTMADVVARDFRSALSKAADAKDRPYYDADRDQVAAEAYYGRTEPEHVGELIRATHRDAPRYKPSLELYPWVDLQPDGKLKSLYTAEIFEPEELIEADFVVLQERAARMIRLRGLDEREPAALEREVEAQLPFNCEHVVPQSWFGKHEPMRGDLHHLFACESRCNGFRGNTPFADFPDFPPDAPAGWRSGPEGSPRRLRQECLERIRAGARQGRGGPGGLLLPAALPRAHLCRGDVR